MEPRMAMGAPARAPSIAPAMGDSHVAPDEPKILNRPYGTPHPRLSPNPPLKRWAILIGSLRDRRMHHRHRQNRTRSVSEGVRDTISLPRPAIPPCRLVRHSAWPTPPERPAP